MTSGGNRYPAKVELTGVTVERFTATGSTNRTQSANVTVPFDAAFSEEFFHVAIGQAVAQIPTHSQQNHIGWEPVPGERSGLDRAATIHRHTFSELDPIRQRNGARQRGCRSYHFDMTAASDLIERSHSSSDVSVRDDLTEAMAAVWERLGAPGATWTGEQRVAMARVVRSALADAEPLPPWVKPSTVDQRVADQGVAPNLSDALYRLTRHAATLSEDWYRDTLSLAEMTPQQWIEAIEIVVAVVAVDGFAAAAGLERPSLPQPLPGAPVGVGEVPAKAARHHWVPVLHLEDDDAGYWGDMAVVPPVVRAMSAVPTSHRTMFQLVGTMYMNGSDMVNMEWSRGTLDRRQIELVAARLSALRECFY